MKAIITAGGRGTRMRPLTFSTNKHFIPLANKPLLFYAIETVAQAGIKEIAVNYNPGQLEEIKSRLGTGKKWGVKFTYLFQEEPLGLGHIVKISQPFVGKEPFLMHLGDNIFHGGIKEFVDYFKEKLPDALVPVVSHKENWRMGVPYFDEKGKLVKYVEKPEDPPNNLAIPGLYFFTASVFGCFEGKNQVKPSPRGEIEISSVFQWLIDHRYRVETKEFEGIWKDPGKFNDWLDTNQFLLDTSLDEKIESKLGQDVRLEGRVRIGRNCQIQSSVLRGPIIIGNRVKIKDSFIGPYSSISDDCQVTEAKVENCVLMSDVRIENLNKPLDSCVIGGESVIEGNDQDPKAIELFIGNQCLLRL